MLHKHGALHGPDPLAGDVVDRPHYLPLPVSQLVNELSFRANSFSRVYHNLLFANSGLKDS